MNYYHKQQGYETLNADENKEGWKKSVNEEFLE